MPDDYTWLQVNPPEDRYCFQHQAKFEREASWRAHLNECSSLFRKKFLCTVVEDDRMCKVEHKFAAALIYHVNFSHNKFLCDKCGSKFDTQDEFQTHKHSHIQTIYGKFNLSWYERFISIF